MSEAFWIGSASWRLTVIKAECLIVQVYNLLLHELSTCLARETRQSLRGKATRYPNQKSRFGKIQNQI
jgi:hypothetical protein